MPVLGGPILHLHLIAQSMWQKNIEVLNNQQWRLSPFLEMEKHEVLLQHCYFLCNTFMPLTLL